ncbi:MAG: hypothetical protein ACRC5T_06130 [Cetobacterium sp.]
MIKVKKKRGIFSVGINNNKAIDNIITLSKSSNDLFDGTIDYFYFRILKFDPDTFFYEIEYPNMKESEKAEYQFLFEEYDAKYKKLFNFEFCEEMEIIVDYVRDEAIKEHVIIEHYSGYVPNKFSFTAQYIMKKILKYYRESI